jgi:hypothetical protein
MHRILSLTKILLIWAAVTLPMGLAYWVITPAFADASRIGPPRVANLKERPLSFATLRAVVLDGADPASLARFYQELTGAPQRPDQDVPQQFHLDFGVADLDAAEKLARRGDAAAVVAAVARCRHVDRQVWAELPPCPRRERRVRMP